MSEEPRITKVEKEKDPRRVEAGKRLGAISKMCKEKKAWERQQQQQHMERVDEEEEDAPGGGYSTITVITGVGVIAGLVCLYFTYKQDRRTQTQNTNKDCEQQPKPLADTKPLKSCKLRSLDD